MSQFVTVPRNSAEGQKLLWGKDPEQRYLPIRSEGIRSQENVTFQVIPKNQIVHPKTGSFLGELIKWRKIIFVLFPFVHWIADSDQVDMTIFSLALISAFTLYLGVSWQADVIDHLKGYEPLGDEKNKSLLGRGILAAGTLHKLAWGSLVISLLTAAPIFLVRPILGAVAVIVAVLIYILFFTKIEIYKRRGVFDFALIALTGPIFSGSLEYALIGRVTFAEIVFGVVWGLLFLFSHALQSFPKSVQLGRQGVEPWLFLKDFDKNKKYFPIFWFCILGFYMLYEALSFRLFLASMDLAVILFFSYKWVRDLQKLNSPLGSEMAKVGDEGNLLVLLFIFLWFMELIFSEVIKTVSRLI